MHAPMLRIAAAPCALRRAGELGIVLLLTDRALRTLGSSYAPMNWRQRSTR